MTDVSERQDAEIPSPEDAALAAESSRILASVRADNGLRVRLSDGQELVLPKAVKSLLSHILAEMASGNAVTIIPIHAELTTQEAADFLNVSRPYLIKLLEGGEMKFHMVGTHRRVFFADLQRYKREQADKAARAMRDLARQAQEMNIGY
ncbi:MAG: helix-turn-helix domain-containing protein [Rhodospirillaceae bacterium]|nr:helix-turn-helix domain-containing protein [Rhodospirillaceae bacterium]